MTKLQKLLAASAMIGASFVMAAPAHALYTVTAGTPFVKGGTTPTTLTLSGNSIVINATDVPALASSGEFSQSFNDGSFITITLNSTAKFAATPTIALNGGPAPTITGGAGSQTLTITFAGGSTGVVNSVTISNITLNTLANTTTNLTATLSGTAFVGATPATYLSKTLASFSDPISFVANASNVTLNTGTTSTSFRDGKGTLGSLSSTITATRAYDGVTAVTLGAPTPVTVTLAAANAGSFSNVTFTESSGAATPCLPASTAVSTGIAAATAIADSATGTANFNGCTVGITLTPSGTIAILPSAVNASVTVPINNAPGITSVVGAGVVGNIATGAGALQSVPLSYNFGADALYGYYVSVTTDNAVSTDSAIATFTSGPYVTSATAAAMQLAPNSTKLFSIETIRTALVAAGAPSSIFANSSARAPLSVQVPAGTKVTALIQNKSTGIVTEVGNNLNKVDGAGINQ